MFSPLLRRLSSGLQRALSNSDRLISTGATGTVDRAPLYTTTYRAENREAVAALRHHNPYALEDEQAAERRMRSYEALDYESMYSDARSLELLRQPKGERLMISVWNWVTYIVLGVLTGALAFVIQRAVVALTALKVDHAVRLLDDGRVGAAFALWLGVSMAYGLVATLLVVFGETTAAGSGIPEVKAFLNGTNPPRFLTPAAGIVKVVGVCFSVSSGLIIGKEGPLIHIGAVLGNVLSTLPKARLAGFRRSPFRSDRHKRDFVSAGAAAGVAGAFSSPVGGICFALEEAASYWSLSLLWRAFLCTMLTASTQWTLAALARGTDTFFGELKYGSFNNESLFRLWEIPLFGVLGLAGGVAGAAFCAANARLSVWRVAHGAPHRHRRVAEVLLVVAATACVTFWLPFLFSECRSAVDDHQCLHRQNRYYCGDAKPVADRLACAEPVYNCSVASTYVRHRCDDGEFNSAATLTFSSLDDAIHAFFHNDASFDNWTLAIYFVVTFALAVVTYGIQVPSGLFVPCIMMGSAMGRLWGQVLRDAIDDEIHPGVYALVGAAAMLAGVTRITITLSVVLFETTNQLYLITPLMLTILIAKGVGDLWNISLYDIHIAIKCLPFVEPEAPLVMQGLVAREVMAAPCVTLSVVGSAETVVETLQRTPHNGFPLVDAAGRYVGLILRNHLVVLLRRRAWRVAAHSGGAAGKPADAARTGNERDDGALVSPADLDAASSLQSKPLTLDEADAAVPPGATLDLRAYANAGAVTVTELCPVPRCFELVRALAIRHMPVLNLEHRPVGMISRQQLSTDYSRDLF